MPPGFAKRETGRREYIAEGYILQCDENAVEIHVTDYHARPLRLAWDDLLAFAEKAQIPVAHTLLGVGAISEDHPLSYGFMGMHGWKHVNRAIQSADLLFAIGMRFDDRVTGNVRTYAPYARIVHVDIDPAEIGRASCRERVCWIV